MSAMGRSKKSHRRWDGRKFHVRGDLVSRPHNIPSLSPRPHHSTWIQQVAVVGGGKHVSSIACNPVSGECVQREQELGALPSIFVRHQRERPKSEELAVEQIDDASVRNGSKAGTTLSA